ENFLRLPGTAGKSEELEINRWWRRWRRRSLCNHGLLHRRCYRLRNFHLHLEDVASSAFVLGVFTRTQPVISQCGIQAAGRNIQLLPTRILDGTRRLTSRTRVGV